MDNSRVDVFMGGQPQNGISVTHAKLNGGCYILILQTFMWVSCGFFWLSFRVSVRVSFRVSFMVSLTGSFRFHLGFLIEISYQVFKRSNGSVSLRVSAGFHLGFLSSFV